MRLTFLTIVSCLAANAAAQPSNAPPATAPTEIRRGVEMSGDREARARQFYERAIAKVEPSLKGDPARIGVYLELFKREFVEDLRTFAVELAADIGSDAMPTIVGHVEFAEHKAALGELFKHLGLQVKDQVELLPSSGLGDKRYGVVAAAATFVRSRPTGRVENLTDCVRGDVVYLLKEAENDKLLCHAPDGYVGYIDSADLRRLDEKELLAIEATVPVRHGERIEQVIEQAETHLGTPYVWGGATREGCDCSGLVRTSFKSAGVVMPRDADQQSLVGRLVGTRWHRSGLRRGDTLFFLSRRGTISHTAIYLGDGKMIEATSPVVKISSFNPTDDAFSERRADTFCFARRVIE